MIDVFIQSYYYRRERVHLGRHPGYGKTHNAMLMHEMDVLLGNVSAEEIVLARAMENQKTTPELMRSLQNVTAEEWHKAYFHGWDVGEDISHRGPEMAELLYPSRKP